jgi:hypothetical protein
MLRHESAAAFSHCSIKLNPEYLPLGMITANLPAKLVYAKKA